MAGIKVNNLPFVCVGLSCLTPVVGAALDVSIFHVPAAVIVAGVALAATVTSAAVLSRSDPKLLGLAAAVLLLLAVQVATGRGFTILGAGGYPAIFACIFFTMFRAGPGVSAAAASRGLTFIYKCLVAAMAVEFIVLIFDQQLLIGQWLASVNAPAYRTFVRADVLEFLGIFPDGRGLNSLLLGPQIASMLALFGMIWFASASSIRIPPDKPARMGFWSVLALALFLLATKGTGLLLFVAFLSLRWLSARRRRVLAVTMGVVVLAVTYVLIRRGILLSRIFSGEAITLSASEKALYSLYGVDTEFLSSMQFYLFQFTSPVLIWLSLDWVNRLLGVGTSWFLETLTSRQFGLYFSGDFGFATDVLLKSGLIWTVVFLGVALMIARGALTRRVHDNADPVRTAWSEIASTNALIALLWLLSGIHYNYVTGNAGGMTLFALHLSLASYGAARVRRPRGAQLHKAPVTALGD